MKNLFTTFALIALMLQGCNCKQEPEFNHDYLAYATIWFQKSPEAKALYYQGFNVAKMQVAEFAKQKGDKPQVVVVDIDETMLDNSPFQAQEVIENRDFSSDFWFDWTKLGRASAVPGAVEFSKYCESLGIEIMYISNRKTNELEATLHNLDSLGFAYARQQNMYFKETESSKKARRQKVSENYDIIMLIGDNLNDFSEVFENRGDDWGVALVNQYSEEFGRRFIILPNPMYGEWEQSMYKSYSKTPAEKQQIRLNTLDGFR